MPRKTKNIILNFSILKKIFIFFVLIFSFSLFSYTYSLENKSGIPENIFQEAIDRNFKPIDEKIEEYLTNLNSSKNYCFWKGRQIPFIDCVDYIEKIFSINSAEYVRWEEWYAMACTKSLWEVIDAQEDKAIASVDAKTIFDRTTNQNWCHRLYLFKLDMYKSVAYDILKKNKYQILKDEHKIFTQNNRTKYDKLLDLFRINLWYLERMWKKWPSKTKK